MNLNQEELKELASQLSHPKGDNGLIVADKMHETNQNMTVTCYEILEPKRNDAFLEIGHGSGKHLSELIKNYDITTYQGIEISKSMHELAKELNAKEIDEGKARFELYDGKIIPVSNNNFDKVVTVNTIYFWEKPIELLNEIYRVLKPGGQCAIGYVNADTMKNLPFTAHGFTLYPEQKIKRLCDDSHFESYRINAYNEKVKSNAGEEIDRKFHVLILSK